MALAPVKHGAADKEAATSSRRSVLAAAGLAATGLPGVAAAVAPKDFGPDPIPAPVPASTPSAVTPELVRWALGLRYEDLPAPVVHEARRYILDSLGCGVAGWRTDKARRAAAAMLPLGGAPQVQVLGAPTRTSAPLAAFVNAELINALDFDAIPHTPPVTLPVLLALAESHDRSGRDLILAAVIAHETASRLSGASSQMMASLIKTGSTPDVYGINIESGFAAVLGAARLVGLDAERTAHAFGYVGYTCPPQMSRNWELLRHKTNVKYNPVGAVCQGATNAVLLAAQGFTTTPDVFAEPSGFDRFYGWPDFKAQAVTEGLGQRWSMLTIDFKPYAACRFIHSQIAAMQALQAKRRIAPDRIAEIRTWGVPFTAHPNPYDVRAAEDAQFSTPYMVALAALGVPIDAAATDAERRDDPRVRALMAKVRWGVHPRAAETKAADRRSYIARVEVLTTTGELYIEEQLYPPGVGALPSSRLSDAALSAKLDDNLRRRLSPERATRAADALWRLDAQPSARDTLSLLAT